jgi:SET domain-containing protein 6
VDATRGDGDGDDRRHYAVYARRAIAPDDVLVASIPKASCLSARTCSCAAALRAERLGGGLALNIAIMHERALGERSRWAGYFAVLPRRGERGLPMFWSEEQRRRLRGTDLLPHVLEDDRALAEDFEEHVERGL